MAASPTKGTDLERRVARVEFADGAIVVVRFPVREPQSDQAHAITDVDVLSLDFDARLQHVVSIFECKSVRGQKGEADRLLTLTGLKKYVGADRAALVRETATGRGRAMARRLGVELLDTKQLEVREQPHTWVPHSFGPVGGSKSAEMHLEVSRALKSIGDFPYSLFDYLRFDALVEPPYRVLGALMTLQQHLERGTVLPRRVERTVLSNGLLALVVAALRTAGRLDALGLVQARALIENGVATGNPYDDSLLRIARLSDALMEDQIDRVHRLYTVGGAKRKPFAPASIRDTLAASPRWLDRFMDLAARLRSRSPIARELPQVVQLACFDALVGDDNWRAPAFDHVFTLEHRQLLSVALDVLEDIVGSDVKVLAGLRAIDFDRSGVVQDRAATFDAEKARRDSPGSESSPEMLFPPETGGD